MYTRLAGGTFDIVAELRGMDDRQARLSASVILDEVEDAESARGPGGRIRRPGGD